MSLSRVFLLRGNYDKNQFQNSLNIIRMFAKWKKIRLIENHSRVAGKVAIRGELKTNYLRDNGDSEFHMMGGPSPERISLSTSLDESHVALNGERGYTRWTREFSAAKKTAAHNKPWSRGRLPWQTRLSPLSLFLPPSPSLLLSLPSSRQRIRSRLPVAKTLILPQENPAYRFPFG